MLETTAQTLADIAVLDDDLDFRTYLEDFLKDERAYTVRTFGNAAEFSRDARSACRTSCCWT